eukprot:2047418-Pleurochrysis_carterae.AAC.1
MKMLQSAICRLRTGVEHKWQDVDVLFKRRHQLLVRGAACCLRDLLVAADATANLLDTAVARFLEPLRQ